VGKITELHAVYYFENWGFDISFETQVGMELSQFFIDFKDNRDGFRAARVGVEFAGAVAIDGHLRDTEGARLRWFIVQPGLQGRGIGWELLSDSLRFCVDAGHRKVFLLTFKGLDCARTLYERAGFVLSEEHEVKQWGSTILEQKFELIL
jgi:GNAT superfamily N-acetyltransferase